MVEKKTEVKFGMVYALSNPSLVDPDDPKGKSILKIGFTERDLEKRVATLSKSTSIPTPFKVEFEELVEAPQQVERLIHAKLADYRISADKEFFKIDYFKAIDVIEKVIYGSIDPHSERDQDGNYVFNYDKLPESFEQKLRYGVDIKTKLEESGLIKESDLKKLRRELNVLRPIIKNMEAEPNPDKKWTILEEGVKNHRWLLKKNY